MVCYSLEMTKKITSKSEQDSLRSALRKFRGTRTQGATATALFMSRRAYIGLETGARPIRGPLRVLLNMHESGSDK